MSYPIIEQYGQYVDVTDNQTAAAILVLADVIADKTIINAASAENLAHKIALMLRAVTPRISVELDGSINCGLSGDGGGSIEIILDKEGAQ